MRRRKIARQQRQGEEEPPSNSLFDDDDNIEPEEKVLKTFGNAQFDISLSLDVLGHFYSWQSTRNSKKDSNTTSKSKT